MKKTFFLISLMLLMLGFINVEAAPQYKVCEYKVATGELVNFGDGVIIIRGNGPSASTTFSYSTEISSALSTNYQSDKCYDTLYYKFSGSTIHISNSPFADSTGIDVIGELSVSGESWSNEGGGNVGGSTGGHTNNNGNSNGGSTTKYPVCEYKPIDGQLADWGESFAVKIIASGTNRYDARTTREVVVDIGGLVSDYQSNGFKCYKTLYYKYAISGNLIFVSTAPFAGSDFESVGTLEFSESYEGNEAGDKIGGSTGGKPHTGGGVDSFFNPQFAIGVEGTGECPAIFGSANQEGTIFHTLKNYVFNPIRILTPIVLVLLTSVDFAKAVFGDSTELMKKAKNNFMKRAAAALIIFLAPTIVATLLTLIDQANVTECLKNIDIGNL